MRRKTCPELGQFALVNAHGLKVQFPINDVLKANMPSCRIYLSVNIGVGLPSH